MKRIVIAVAGAGLVVAAVGVALATSGEDSTPEAQAPTTSTPTQPTDVSRDVDPGLTTEQIKQQAAQVLEAQEQIKQKVDQHARLLRERQEREPSE